MVAHIWRDNSPVSEQTFVAILSICEFSDYQLKLHMPPAPVLSPPSPCNIWQGVGHQ